MNKSDNNNEILSFEELRKKLGMDEDDNARHEEKIQFEELSKDVSKQDEPESDNASAEKSESEQSKQNTKAADELFENNETFVDITDQYVKKDNGEKNETPVQPQSSKKKVRTFNEIFSNFFKGFLPLKKDSTKEKIRKIIMDISIIVIIGCAIAFGELYRQHRVQLNAETEIKGKIVDTDNMSDDQYGEAWKEIIAQYPNIEMPEGMNLKYAYLYALNQDLVGWLKIGNTNLDVQVVQSDDNDYYLGHDFYEKKSRYGCPYVDYRNDAKYLDDNTIIYGHHMPDGLMFSQLDKYKTLEGYKDSPIIQFDTIYETYYFKVFAAFISNADAESDNGYIFNYTVTNFSTDNKFKDFIDNVKQRSIFDTGISVEPDDKLLTLVTCSYEFGDARLVVMGRMVRENEEITVDTSTATLNPSPRYPQAWYDAKRLTNPYAEPEKTESAG